MDASFFTVAQPIFAAVCGIGIFLLVGSIVTALKG